MRLSLVIWYAIWAYVAMPWRNFQLRPSFDHANLIPFVDGSLRGNVLNVVAFMPLGIIGSFLGWRPVPVVLLGALTSGLTETLQLFSTSRYPSVTDVVLNVAGTALGLILIDTFDTIPSESHQHRSDP